MNLVANECAACRRPAGYVPKGAIQLPMFCVLCAGDAEVMEEWFHRIDNSEKPIFSVLRDYYLTLQSNPKILNPKKGKK